MKKQIELNQEYIFPTPVYWTDLPGYLDDIKEVYPKYFDEKHQDAGFPNMGNQMLQEPKLEKFCTELQNIARDILNADGYDMQNFDPVLHAMWVQEHGYLSSMEYHVHGNGDQLVGFYFIDAPKNCGSAIFHDPRPGKVQINLPEKNRSESTTASSMINYKMVPGRLIIAPSWVPHSFTKNMNKKESGIFIHINIGVGVKQQCQTTPVEYSRPTVEVI